MDLLGLFPKHINYSQFNTDNEASDYWKVLVEGICFLEESLLFITLVSFREREIERREREGERGKEGGGERKIYMTLLMYIDIVYIEIYMIKSKLSDET